MGFWDNIKNDKGLTVVVPPLYYNDQFLYNRAPYRILGDGYNVQLFGNRYSHYYYPPESANILSKLPPFGEWTSTLTVGITFENGAVLKYRNNNNYAELYCNYGSGDIQLYRVHKDEIIRYTPHKLYFLVFPYDWIEANNMPTYNSSDQNPLPLKIINKPSYFNEHEGAFIRISANRAYGGTKYGDVQAYIACTGRYSSASEYYFEFDASNYLYEHSVDIRRMLYGDTDPTFQDDTSKTQGGKGKYKYVSDDIDIPELPVNNVFSTSLVTAYQMSLSQLDSYSDFLWSENFVNTIKKLMNDPLEAVISLSTHSVPNLPLIEAEVHTARIDTNIMANKVTNQWIEVDCGSLKIEEFWGTVMDYSPNTSVQIFLPYCGVYPLSVNEVMDSTITIKYHVDMLSGSCIAFVKVSKEDGVNSVLYNYNGNVLSQLPLTSSNHSEHLRGLMNIAGNLAGLGASIVTGNPLGALSSGVRAVGNTITSANRLTIGRSGPINSQYGMLNIQKPYLIICRAEQSLAEGYNGFNGFPSNITKTLGDLSGYTEVEVLHLENIHATSNELVEIENLLNNGVIL